MASLRCHGDSDCSKTHIIRNFHLYIKQLWKPFFHIFTHCDVVDAQTWEVSPPKKSNRATLSWLSHPRAREIWPRTNALCPLSKSKRPAKEDILDMARENAHLQQHAWGYFAFKFTKCSDDRTLPLLEKIYDSMGFRAANRLRVDKVRTAGCFSVQPLLRLIKGVTGIPQ